MDKKGKFIKVDYADWKILNDLKEELAFKKGGTWFMHDVIKELINSYKAEKEGTDSDK